MAYRKVEESSLTAVADAIRARSGSSGALEFPDGFVEAVGALPVGGAVTSVNGKTGAVQLSAADVGALSADTLPGAVDDALAQAKASGEFDGEKGDKGDPGEIGPTGPQGDPGEPGYTPIKGIDYFDGQPGKDGVSVTHEWDGTVLKITSSSGTSSADLKGDSGTDGKDGYTPQKGVDYFDGAPGPKGDKGDTGATGPQGPQGPKGDTGATGPAGKDGQPGKDGSAGAPGADGISPTVSVSKSGKVTTISVTDKNGTKTATINDGADGSPGSAGADGKDGTSVTVKSVSESTADGGSNVVTFSDGKTVTIKNGSKGSAGAAGKTPVKGVDYWTPADQEAIVQQVISALGTPVFGRVDADNNIILTGELADGTYTFQYEDEDGNTHPLGSYTKVPKPTYTNVLPLSIGDDGAVFNGTGYIDGYRLSSNYNTNAPHYVSAQSGYFTTGFLPYTIENCSARVPFYVKGVNLDSLSDYARMAMYTGHTATYNSAHTANLNSTGAAGFEITKLGDQYYKITPGSGLYNTGGTSSGWGAKNATVARLSLPGSGAGVILTINEPIE